MYSLQEVARMTGLAERTIRRWIKSGKIAAALRAGQYVIEEQELQKLPHPRRVSAIQTTVSPAPAVNQEEGRKVERDKFIAENIASIVNSGIQALMQLQSGNETPGPLAIGSKG